MRGSDRRSGELFSYIDIESRIRADHPLRTIKSIVDDAQSEMSAEFDALYAAKAGRPSTPPEMLLRAMLLQAFYTIRSERQLMERLEYDFLSLVRRAGDRRSGLGPVHVLQKPRSAARRRYCGPVSDRHSGLALP